jgi:hypothetical protein
MNNRSRVRKDCPSVSPFRRIFARPAPISPRVFVGLCALGLGFLAAPQGALAQGRLDARYEVTLAGIPVGTSASQGRIVAGALVPQAYVATTVTSKKSETVRMGLVNGYVKEFAIDPEPPVDPDRIPVTDAHRHGVFDPMTGSMLRVPGNADLMSPESCHAGQAVFDGRMRYDLKLDFKRLENVRADKGYSGPALVCAIYFSAVSGYIPDRPVIKYLTAQRNMEIAFVPIAGTRILVPFRMSVPTPLGTAVLEATEFHTSAAPPHPAKTQ